MHVAHLVHRSAQRWPHRPLWLAPDVTVSYAQGAERLNLIARQLLTRGAQRDRVAILSTNRFEAFEVYLAAMSAGMAAVPLNPKLHPSEHAFILGDCTPRFVIYSAEYENHLAGMRGELTCVEHWIRIGGKGPSPDETYDTLLAGSDASHPDVTIELDDLAWLFYTSGTTGKPKGAMETHRNLLTMVQHFLIAILRDACETDVMLHAAPIAHGTASVGLAHLAVGAAQCFPVSPSFDPAHIFELIERWRVSSSFLAPTMIQMLLRSPERTRHDLSSLKNVIYGGGPMYVELLKEALAAFGPVFHQIFGQGEAPMTCTALPKWEHRLGGDPQAEQRLASAGREMCAVQIRILDERDRPVADNMPGEIAVRGDLVMAGYWNNPAASAETLRGGWLHTGDIGHLDEHGYLYITDRKKDLIVSGGSNIYPREVEEVLLQHPAVAEVSVIGVPHDTWGETVKAVIVLRERMTADEQDLIEFCRGRIASYKKPTSVDLVDALPKSAYGKVLKRELRDRYWADRVRKI